jgi:hypothetical protein
VVGPQAVNGRDSNSGHGDSNTNGLDEWTASDTRGADSCNQPAGYVLIRIGDRGFSESFAGDEPPLLPANNSGGTSNADTRADHGANLVRIEPLAMVSSHPARSRSGRSNVLPHAASGDPRGHYAGCTDRPTGVDG